jgi:hypothetical protein
MAFEGKGGNLAVSFESGGVDVDGDIAKLELLDGVFDSELRVCGEGDEDGARG